MADIDADREEIRSLEQEWMEAHQRRDGERLEELVADGFRFTAIHLNPEPMTREQWLGAVVHSRFSQIASYTVDLSNVFRVTDVWSRRDGRWQVVARHSSILG